MSDAFLGDGSKRVASLASYNKNLSQTSGKQAPLLCLQCLASARLLLFTAIERSDRHNECPWTLRQDLTQLTECLPIRTAILWLSPQQHKRWERRCDLSTQEVETGRSGIQSHPCLNSMSRPALMRQMLSQKQECKWMHTCLHALKSSSLTRRGEDCVRRLQSL